MFLFLHKDIISCGNKVIGKELEKEESTFFFKKISNGNQTQLNEHYFLLALRL